MGADSMMEVQHTHKLPPSVWKMANSLEKLERLFTGSRRRERGRQKTPPVVIAPQPSSPLPLFPSPSFLRPTSMRMVPRDAHIDGPSRDQGRSCSVPILEEALRKRSSTTSSITVVNSRPSRSIVSNPSPRRVNGSRQPPPVSSQFRFPEDSLFTNDRLRCRPEESGSQNDSREQSPRTLGTRHCSEKGMLDWTPKHISFLFNPLEFNSPLNNHRWGSTSDCTESTLLPSPDFTPSMLLPDRPEIGDNVDNSALIHPALRKCNSVQRLTLTLRQQSLSTLESPLPDSPPASDIDEGDRRPTILPALPLHALGSPHSGTDRPVSANLSPIIHDDHSRNSQVVRETWCKRLEDICLSSPSADTSEDIPPPRPMRQSASTSSLSVLTIRAIKDQILKEPTFDDFYALSDDDIAESPPLMPVHDDCLLQTPPRKDMSRPYRKNRLPQTLSSQTPGEITPPFTPTDSHLLTLTYSPTNTFGVVRAAELAMKYDFAVLYVLSLWPVRGDTSLDVSTTTVTSDPQSSNTALTERLGTSHTSSRITGCLLAAYGLNEVPSPFEIVTETHLAALNCDHWNEYRNIDARPDDISRGWIRPFYGDFDPVPDIPEAAEKLTDEHNNKNRGIVFAAYSKPTSKHGIPVKTSAEQLFLQQLYLDAKALVDALVEQNSS